MGVRLPALGLDLADGARDLWTESLDGLTDHDIDRITHLNAMRHFHYDPFTALGGKENCTVGALRQRAAGHDVSIQSQDQGRASKSGDPVGRPPLRRFLVT